MAKNFKLIEQESSEEQSLQKIASITEVICVIILREFYRRQEDN